MKYTYDDFVNAAKAAGMYGGFSREDLATAQNSPEYGLSLLKLQQDVNGAKTAEQKLLGQEAINQLRSSYGQLPAASSAAEASGKTAYQQALEKVTMPGGFSYDPAQDPSFAAMKKGYLREGQRAMENTLASASAGTGGVPSTAAITAAKQANDYYNTQFNDAIPGLQQTAYQQYLNEFGNDVTRLEALKADEQQKIENALLAYQVLGYATPEIAQILGIPYTPQRNSGGKVVYYEQPAAEDPESANDLMVDYEQMQAILALLYGDTTDAGLGASDGKQSGKGGSGGRNTISQSLKPVLKRD